MRKNIGILLICILLISVAMGYIWWNSSFQSSSPEVGNTYYVSIVGIDSNPGTLSSPFRTIQKAMDVVNPGDIVYVRDGTYNENPTLTRSGNSSAWITIKNYPGELPVIDGTGMTPSYWAGGTLEVGSVSYVIIDGFKIQDSEASGICVLRSNNVIVKNCQTMNTGYSGIRVCYGEGTSNLQYCTNIKVLNNIIDQSNMKVPYGQEALSFSGVSNSEIRGNLLTSTCTKEGIDCKHDCINITIAYNDIYTPGTNIYLGDAPNDMGSDYIVYGNRCYGSNTGLAISVEKCGTANNFFYYNNIIECDGNGFQINYDPPTLNLTCMEGPQNVYIINNVFNVGGTALRLSPPVVGNYARNVIIRNNIFKGKYGITMNAYQPEDEVTIDHNFFTTGSDYYGSSYYTGDPKWVNPSFGDYHLQSTSPAIDTGSNIDAPSVDFDGNTRPQGNIMDIGAFEYSFGN
jgi:hypothetical protein